MIKEAHIEGFLPRTGLVLGCSGNLFKMGMPRSNKVILRDFGYIAYISGYSVFNPKQFCKNLHFKSLRHVKFLLLSGRDNTSHILEEPCARAYF